MDTDFLRLGIIDVGTYKGRVVHLSEQAPNIDVFIQNDGELYSLSGLVKPQAQDGFVGSCRRIKEAG